MEASTRSLSTTNPTCNVVDGPLCLAPFLCGRRERELGSNLIYVSGCFRDGSPRLYTGESGKDSEEIEAPE
jgi:hypothetical protein